MFTREAYLEDYKQIYDNLGVAGSGAPELKKCQAYYDLPMRGGYIKGDSLLDYGCGWGAMCAGIDALDYYGCDIVPRAIELAKEHFPNKQFEVLDIGKLNIPQKDFCIALSVFTHTLKEDVDECLGDIARNTKKGALIDILEGDDSQSNLHIRYCNKEEFIKKLEKFGFKVRGEFKIMAQFGYEHTYLICNKKIWLGNI